MTVSRVLNGSGPVAPETRKRVLAAIAELGYHPNAVARSLARERTSIVGVLLDDASPDTNLRNPFYLEILTGIITAARQASYDVLVFSSRYDTTDAIRKRTFGLVAGLILMGGALRAHLANEPLPIPVVTVGRRPEYEAHASWVAPDYATAFEAMVAELARYGHRELCLLYPSEDFPPDMEKVAAFRQACDKLGITARLIDGVHTQHDAYQVALERLVPSRATAVLAVNSDILAGVLLGLRDGGIQPGRDISVSGINDNDRLVEQFGAILGVKVRSWRIPAETLGVEAVNLLLKAIADTSLRACLRVPIPDEPGNTVGPIDAAARTG